MGFLEEAEASSIEVAKHVEVAVAMSLHRDDSTEDIDAVLRRAPRIVDVTEACCAEVMTRVMMHAKEKLCKWLAVVISKQMAKEAKSKLIATSAEKQRIAKHYNGMAAQYGLTFLNPGTLEPCNLIAVSDVWGGKFTLESRATKKRTHGTKDPTKLPILLVPLPLPTIITEEEVVRALDI